MTIKHCLRFTHVHFPFFKFSVDIIERVDLCICIYERKRGNVMKNNFDKQ